MRSRNFAMAPISIHALREEGDWPPGHHCEQQPISIHALREEGDVRSGSLRQGTA